MLSIALGAGFAKPLRVLCLGAHSDDIEIGCGGTVQRLLKEHPGSAVDWVVFSATPERELEARASAVDFLVDAATTNVSVNHFRESHFPYVAADIKAFFETLKQLPNPDVIFCHHRQDLHQDHRTLAELAWNTFRDHLIFEYEIPKYEGDWGTPNVFVPLSRAIAERKVELVLRHFASQSRRTWFHADTFHAVMTLRGIECNAAEGRAEAFHARKISV